jgi:superfamily II DNA or RNA helicase
MQILPSETRVGDLVRVRRQRWRVTDAIAHDACRLLTLSGASATNLGIERRFVSPFDVIDRVDEPRRPRIVGPHRWRGELRTLIADAGSAETLRTASRADITLLPHQLEPALAMTRGMGTRVLIADEVGLGKTIQAGLIVSELVDRGAAERVLIVTPAGLRDQWLEELRRRFGLEGELIDAREVRQRASRLTVGVNPWTTCPIAVTSSDYIKRPEVLAAAVGCRWDVLVVDEAHGAAPGTERHRALSVLAARAPYVVLLTATPHSGDRAAFRALCDLGSHARTTTPGPRPEPLLAFRRTRQEVALGPGRRVHRLVVEPTADERRMHALLGEFTRAVRQDRGDANRDVWLALTMLHKRAFSSARALELSIRRRLLGLTPNAETSAQLFLPLDDADAENDEADAEPAWTGPGLNDADHERVMLSALAGAAADAARAESKVARLTRLLAALARRHEHALVFTEYRDTLLHLQDRLPVPSVVLHGGLTRVDRRSAVDGFDSGRTTVLLATDAAGEGLNLHRACRVVINLELPWSPVRLEQRVGRVDRIGQPRRVHAFHMIARGTGEAAIADRLRARIAVSRAEMGGADPLDDTDGQAETLAERQILGGVSPRAGAEALAIAGAEAGPGRPVGPAGQGNSDEHPFQLIRLRPEARAEQARLARARRLIGRGSSLNGRQGPLIARERAPAMRAMLGSTWLVVVRSAIEDVCGRPVAVYLTPLRLHVALPRALALSVAAGTVSEIEAHVAGAVRRDREAWVASSVGWHSAFWAARLAREQSAATAVEEGELRQFGLFTRRAGRLGPDQRAEAADIQQRSGELVGRTSELRVTAGRVAVLVVP